MLGFYGRDLGHRVARKHLGWYMDHIGTSPDLRKRIVTEAAPDAVLRRIPDMVAPYAEAA
jgi:hypothetical protein